jgi:hypothetical protein
MVWKNVFCIEHLLLIPCVPLVHAVPGLLLVQTAAPYPETPILTRIETYAGHDFGKPTAKVIEARADILAFHAA